MCGLTGFYADRDDGESTIGQMTRKLRHRGPDGQRWASPARGVWLGHARLKVIDLSEEASQPMTHDGLWIVFNGEIYNYRQIRRELEEQGSVFQTQSDTEVILGLYRRMGPRCVRRLDGMFALAIWDGEKIFLARDFSGKKPLYYARGQNRMFFASEPKALVGLVQMEPDPTLIPYGAVFGSPPLHRSWYRGIDQLPPGTSASYFPKEDQFQVTRWWKYPAPGKSAVRPETKIRQLLTEAVEKRLVADVPLGVFLSGGIDSTVVVGLLRKIRPHGEIRTFSAKFVDDPRYDESPFAEMVAARYRTRHTTLPIRTPGDRLLEGVLERHDGPFGDSSAIPFHLLSQEAKKHVTVALTGDGGDEVFGGYLRMRACLWAQWFGRILPGHWIPETTEMDPKKNRTKILRFLRAAALPMPARLWRWISLMEPAELGTTWNDLDRSLGQRWDESKDWPLQNRILHMNFLQYLAEDLLPKGDRNSMAEGLEIRCPFLDRALVEYAASLPGKIHFDWFQGKKLLRRACGDLIPAAVLRRRKMGFGIPLRRSAEETLSFRRPLPISPQGRAKMQVLDRNSQAGFFADQLARFFAPPDPDMPSSLGQKPADAIWRKSPFFPAPSCQPDNIRGVS